MKIKKANHILFLIPLSLSWVTSECILSTVQTNRGSQSHGKNLPVHPSYSQICSRRINKLDITSNRIDDDDDYDEKHYHCNRQFRYKGIKQRPVNTRRKVAG
jgi:hypothetical protein